MKNPMKHIFGAALLFLGACAAEEIPMADEGGNGFAWVAGGKVTVEITLDSPAMPAVSTRSGLSESPDYDDLRLWLVEFDDNGSPMRNTFKTLYTPDSEAPASDRIAYRVTLNQSDQPRILHLIALPKGETLDLRYGVEGSLIPSLTTSAGTPAYWRRLAFPSGYASESGGVITPAKELDQLRHVALVRNFACISMEDRTGGNFILSGFAIINNPEACTMAPYSTSDTSFPEFLGNTGETLPYAGVAGKYSGVIPAGLSFSNPESAPEVGDDTAPKYMYERPFNSIRHTYILIKGRRKDDAADSYYKLDLGRNDSDGIFRYYDILRNYRYNVVLNSVGAKGYSSVEEAVNGVVYNNFSFDVELSGMLNISDGSEVVYVNFTTSVLTSPEEQTIEFLYRYRSLSSANPTYSNDNVKLIGLEKGSVIKSYSVATSDDSDGWRRITLTCHAAEAETKTQSFTIVKESGLGRTVNLILHRKWDLSNLRQFAGTLADWDASTSGAGWAGPEIGAEMTVFFDIPDNLQESMFPLTFTLEADRQNVENNPAGSLVVTYGNSGFSGIDGRRIKYLKTISWTDYNDLMQTSDPYSNGTVINNPNGTVTHRVRCHLKAITQLTDYDFTQSLTRILVTNPNFNDAIATFIRVQ